MQTEMFVQSQNLQPKGPSTRRARGVSSSPSLEGRKRLHIRLENRQVEMHSPLLSVLFRPQQIDEAHLHRRAPALLSLLIQMLTSIQKHPLQTHAEAI